MQQQTKILVVDDDIIVAMDIKIRLEKFKYNVVGTAASGTEAIACVKELKPNLIIMDIVLKGDMDGIAAAQTISEYYGIPIIFLTGYREDEDKFNRAKLTIPYGYITKPFETRDLDIAIQLAIVRKEMEQKLALKEIQYQLLMDNATCGLFIYDNHGVILDINKQGATILGASKSAIIHRDFREFVIASEQEYATVQLEKLKIEKHIGPNIGHISQPNGAIRDVEFSSTGIETQEGELYLCVLDDHTEKNKMYEQALLTFKMASVGTLAAGIIHEINNPLNWLLSNLQFIKDQIKALPTLDAKGCQLTHSLAELTDEAMEGAKIISTIVRSLKEFSHVDDNQLVPVDIIETLNTAIHIVEHETKLTMKLKKEFCDDIPLLLLSNNKLQQVFINLIVNASQSFSNPENLQNTLIIKIVLEKDHLRIEFTDNGCGIAPENIPRLFTPFFTTKPVGIGTGLGLSICYTIIHDMGGDIRVESVVNTGSIFTIILPLNLKTVAGSEIKKYIIPASQLNILIVDDTPNALKTLHRLLMDEHNITDALGGREALTILQQRDKEFDLVITDINMSDVNGIDLYRFIKQKHPQLIHRIIFITGGVSSERVALFLADINIKHLDKPYTPEELNSAIATIYPATESSCG
jgi:PAS domain S-box-containing protein